MKTFSTIMGRGLVGVMLFTMVACVKQQGGGDPTPPVSPDQYFDFATRSSVQLNVDYGVPGLQALVEIYDEEPVEIVSVEVTAGDGKIAYSQVKKEDVEALYKAYTNKEGKLSVKMDIASSVKEVYIYTSTLGLTESVKVPVNNKVVDYNASSNTKSSFSNGIASYAYGFAEEKAPYFIKTATPRPGGTPNPYSLYSLCKWGEYGTNMTSSLATPYIKNSTMTSNNKSTIAALLNRVDKFLGSDNSAHKTDPKVLNINTTENDTDLDLVFLTENAMYNSGFGYFYYKTNAGLSDKEIYARPKYVVFPNVNSGGKLWYKANEVTPTIPFNGTLQMGDKVRLQFFGENGTDAPVDKFPAGYTVCWFLLADGYMVTANNNEMAKKDEYTDNVLNSMDPMHGGTVTSIVERQYTFYISLYDKTSDRLVLGIEDGADKDFKDMMFFIESSKMGGIVDPENPPIDPDPELKEETRTVKGTYAFEDIWPTGGDYDMNDVVIEYQYDITFKGENVTKIVDVFRPVHNGAGYFNGFAYQMVGEVGTVAGPVTYESDTKSIIAYTDHKVEAAKKSKFTYTRTFAEGDLKNADVNSAYYNPFIIVDVPNKGMGSNRIEVHLPKHKATSKMDQSLLGSKDDAFYIKKDGKYPFAIDIPIFDFKVVTEKVNIAVEYPNFTKWVESNGGSNQDWYKK